MAKRKCLSKRLSGYSKHSIGSAILDPDTETLDDEYPYWWKNVENNAIVRPSIDANVLNQTSRYLDSDTQIETSEAEDEWWKALEDTNTSKTLKMKMKIAKHAEKDASNNNTSTSESLGEVKMARKRFTMRSKPKRSRDNAFLNVLDGSMATSTVELGQVDDRKSSTRNSATVGVTVTNLKNKDETEENSFNQSQKTSAILKLKPTISNKNYKNEDKNLFYNVLKESKLQISLREGNNDKFQTATNALVANSVSSDDSALSLEDENDIPHVFVPEAQSTLLKGSTSSMHDSNSDIVDRVFEKKSKLLTRYKANVKRNLFEDTLIGQEAEKSDLISKDDATGGEAFKQSARSSRISEEASGKDIREKREHASLSIKNTNEFRKSNVLPKTCVASSDTLDLLSAQTPDATPTCITKTESKEGKSGPRRNSREKSIAQETLVSPVETETDISFESENITKKRSDRVSQSTKHSSHRFSAAVFEGGSPKQSSRRQSSRGELIYPVGAEDDLEGSEEDIPRQQNDLSSKSKIYSVRNSMRVSEVEDAENISQRNTRSRSKVSFRSISPVTEQNRRTEPADISTKQSDRSRKSIKHSFGLISSDSEADSPKRSSRKQSSRREEFVAPVGPGDDIEGIEEDIPKQQRDRSSKSKINSVRNSMRVSEIEDAKNISQRNTRSRSKVSFRSISPVTEQNRRTEPADISTKQSDRSRKSIKHSFGLISSDSEADSPKQSSSRQSSRGELIYPVGAEDDLEGSEEDIPRQQNDLSSKSKIYSVRNSMRVSEVEDAENISQRNTRSRSKVSFRSISSVTEQNRRTEPPDISTKQSDRSRKSIKHSFGLISSDSEADSPKRSSRKQSSRREEFVAPVEPGDDLEGIEEDIPKQQSDRLSKSKIYSVRNSMRVSEIEDAENISQRNTRSRNKVLLGSLSSVTEQNRRTEPPDIFTKQSDLTIHSGLSEVEESREGKEDDEVNGAQRDSMLSGMEDMEEASSSKARKRLTLSIRNGMEPEEVEKTAERQKRSSNRIEAWQLVSNTVSEFGQGDTRRKSNSANISEKQVVSSGRKRAAAESQDENSIVQQKVSKSNVLVSKYPNVVKLREGVNTESESLSSPIKEIDRRDGSPSKFEDGNEVNEREESGRKVSRGKGVGSKLQRDTSVNQDINTLTRSFRKSDGKVSGSKATNLTASSRTRKLLSSNVSKGQQNIESFFGSVRRLPDSREVRKTVSLEDVNKKLEKVKEWAMSRVNIRRNKEGEARAPSKQKRIKEGGGVKKTNPTAQRARVAKQIDKAFLVNGQVYKVPRLPRPKTWITDRLYNYLWKRMEPKYKLQTRVVSEKFILQLSNVATLIVQRKLYDNYKAELYALMKEMARLGLIITRKDFYDFSHEFLPYELRVKIIPMLLPGNKRTIPYEASNLYTPLLADK